MSGLIDLSGLASRAYAPRVQQSQNASIKPETSEINRPAPPAVSDRRLAPAFSIELSLAAQKALNEPGEGAKLTPNLEVDRGAANPATADRSLTGVGRREVPLASDQRNVRSLPVGSRLNIQI